MKTCYLIGAGPLGEIRDKIRAERDDLIICADGGYRHAEALGVVPDLLIGDFDSIGPVPEPSGVERTRLPREKDDTDLISAARYAMERGFRSFVVYGALGGRLDHTFAALQTLSFLLDRGAQAVLTDGRNRAYLMGKGVLNLKREDCYLSVFSYSDCCSDVSIRGVKYPLEHGRLTSAYPVGVSNEFAAEEATVSNADGKLLIILSARDLTSDGAVPVLPD